MTPEAKAALRAELKAAKTAAEAESVITKLARSAGYKTFDKLKKAVGSAGVGKVWHHVVEQSQIPRFGDEAIHTFSNVVAVSVEDNLKLAAIYKRTNHGEIACVPLGISPREWLKSKTFEEARQFGMLAVQNVKKGTWK